MSNTVFSNAQDFVDMVNAFPVKNIDAEKGAMERNAVLTKPPAALGRLEDIAIWYASWRGKVAPRVTNPQVVVFAANHGVTAQGVSAFPAEVTAQMVKNFEMGGAAINQLSKAAGARMFVHAIDLGNPTQDFTTGPAMTEQEFLQAIQMGWDAVDPEADLFVTGEMGIGNTTAAAAVSAGLFGGAGQDWVGRGTGVNDEGLALKAKVVDAGLELIHDKIDDPMEIIRCLGGRELVAMMAAIASARAKRIPVILDGFICSASAAVLYRLNEGALDHCVAGHVSQEQGHETLLNSMGKEPLLSLGLRLGEGTGAALAISIVKAALECHSGMATFAEAGVADG